MSSCASRASRGASAAWPRSTRSGSTSRPARHERDHRPERCRQDHAVQPDLGIPAERPAGVSCSMARASPALAPDRIAARGLVRTFQLVQLFADLTVLENVRSAAICIRAAGCLRRCCPASPDSGTAGWLGRAALSSQAARRTRRDLAAALPMARNAPRDRARARGRTQNAAARRASRRPQPHGNQGLPACSGRSPRPVPRSCSSSTT